MHIKDIHNVYFLGIGGIGMSALAQYFKFIGKNVAGYDKTETPLTKELVVIGINIHYKDDLNNIEGKFLNTKNTLVVYTPALYKNNKELYYFKTGGFTVKKRAEVLGIITRDTFCFAVAGTHGKTTTSCILAHLLKETGVPFTAFLGGISEDFNSNFLSEGTEYSVVEADEYDRSFLQLVPNIACITSMDADHLDIYGSGDELHRSFKDFVGKLKSGGKLYVRNGLPIKGITYGIADNSDFCIQNLKIEQGNYVFDLITPKELLSGVEFCKPGKHNLLNGLVAFAMALDTGVSSKCLAEALGTFKGVQRRFSYRIKRDDFIFIDDYAHHPTEINAVYDAIVEMHPNKKILAVFQPHLFSRTQYLADDFAKSLSQFDSVLLLDIYAARETPIAGISSEWLLDKINTTKKKIKKIDLIEEIKMQAPEVLIVMGAGDIGLEVSKIEKELAYENRSELL